MDVTSIGFDKNISAIAGAIYKKSSIELLQISVALTPVGTGLAIMTNRGMAMGCDALMGEGWLSRLADEISEALTADDKLHAVIEKYAGELLKDGVEKLERERKDGGTDG